MNEFSVPYLSYDRIREIACQFLGKHHPFRKLPIPIEEIIEFQLGINIIPMPGLQEALDDDEVVGFTSSDLKDITVDEFIWRHRPGRYRFTLAHEVGHITLHQHLYEPLRFHSIEEWKKFINSIPDKEHGRYEWQAYAFAGLILVPEDRLKEVVDKHMKAVLKLLKKDDISPSEAWESMRAGTCKKSTRQSSRIGSFIFSYPFQQSGLIRNSQKLLSFPPEGLPIFLK